MAKAKICAGICGFNTTVQTKMEDDIVRIQIQSDCAAINRLGTELTEVNPFQEISFRRSGPLTLQLGQKFCSHTACPVPVGIIKAIEVEAGLALPADATIHVERDTIPD